MAPAGIRRCLPCCWNDATGSENADKCAWIDTQNITLGSHPFAMQPLWSNEAFDAIGNGCVVTR